MDSEEIGISIKCEQGEVKRRFRLRVGNLFSFKIIITITNLPSFHFEGSRQFDKAIYSIFAHEIDFFMYTSSSAAFSLKKPRNSHNFPKIIIISKRLVNLSALFHNKMPRNRFHNVSMLTQPNRDVVIGGP